MKFTFLFLLTSFFFTSCGGYQTQTSIKAEKGYLKFIGDIYTVSVEIDENEKFLLDREIEVYELKPGKHSLKVYKDKQLVINRIIIIDNQTTMEIQIP